MPRSAIPIGTPNTIGPGDFGHLPSPPEGIPQSWWEDMAVYINKRFGPEAVEKHLNDQQWAYAEYAKVPPEKRRKYDERDKAASDGMESTPGTPEYWEEKRIRDAEDVREENKATLDELAGLPLDELEKRYGLSSEQAQQAHDTFVAAVNGYVDPEIAAALPDLVSQAAASKADQGAIDAQWRSLGKAEALTDIKETAEEKFMREQERRTQERDLRSQREADRNSLLARGAYGSGAEIAMNAQAQQEAAERRMLEELGANANAQKRALDAIGQMGTISGDIRRQSFDEDFKRGTAADAIADGNRSYKQHFNEWKLREQTAQEQGKIDRAGLTRNSEMSRIAEDDKRSASMWGAKSDVAGKRIGQNQADSGAVQAGFGGRGVGEFTREQVAALNEEDDGIFGLGVKLPFGINL